MQSVLQFLPVIFLPALASVVSALITSPHDWVFMVPRGTGKDMSEYVELWMIGAVVQKQVSCRNSSVKKQTGKCYNRADK